MQKPKITFMTASYNNKKMIELTIKSILAQDYNNIEHIILDSASTDGTVEMIRSYEGEYVNGKELKWVSKKDKGIYDAYNKMIDMATGEYLVICADPLYEAQTTTIIVDNLLSGDYDCCIGELVVIDDSNNFKITRKFNAKQGNIRWGWMPAVPTFVFKKSLIEKYGDYDEEFDISADYEFAVRLFKDKNLKCISIHQPLVLYYAGGVSNGTIKGNLDGLMYGIKGLKANNIKFPYSIGLFRVVRTLWQYRFKIMNKYYKNENWY